MKYIYTLLFLFGFHYLSYDFNTYNMLHSIRTRYMSSRCIFNWYKQKQKNISVNRFNVVMNSRNWNYACQFCWHYKTKKNWVSRVRMENKYTVNAYLHDICYTMARRQPPLKIPNRNTDAQCSCTRLYLFYDIPFQLAVDSRSVSMAFA